jgi:Zn-dependent M28 family amino/carboxypeptidase
MHLNRYFIFVVIIGLSSCSRFTGTNAVFNKDSLAHHIQILSSDSFMGRRPFTIGEERTVNYMQSTFTHLGLEPGNNNSYTQDVPLVEITPDADSIMTVQSDTSVVQLHKGTDYVISTERVDSVISLNNDQVVFAGYGVVAPEYNWNDYAGLDVKDKIVLVMVNDPGFGNGDTTMFKGETMTYYGRWTYKYEEAARQGAKACFIIHNTAGASYPFSVVQTSWGKSNLYLDTRGTDQYHLALKGWVTHDAANKLLQMAGRDSTLLASADQRGFKGMPLGIKLSTTTRVKAVYNKSENVIAKITGSKHPDEYIIYTAHWDHLGIGKPDARGDSIYNGAVDNASGSAALLEMARAFKSLDPKPERTIVFLSVTAEEQGLLGSAYYTLHPIFPLDKTVGEINMDGMSAFGKTKDVIITGARQSDLEDYLTEEAAKQHRYIAPESHPEAGHYFRSDHFNFAHVGVPALNAAGGIDMEDGGKEAGRKLEDEYTAKHYHQPSDEFDPKWSLEGCLQDMELLFNVGKRLAFETTWPQWKEGSEFKKIRSH